MDPSQLVKTGLAILFVLVNGWFVVAEFAFIRVRTTRLEELAAEKNRAAELALSIVRSLDSYLASIQLGITLASLALGWLGEPAFARLFAPAFAHLPGGPVFTHGLAITLAFLGITFLHVTLGEQVPKIIAIQRADTIALAVARPLHLFYLLTYPFMRILQGTSNRLVRAFGYRSASEAREAHTEDELRLIVAASHREGILDEATRDLLDNVFEYTERITREVMTPRRDVAVLEVQAPVDQSIQTAIDKEYTRYPLLDPENDRVIGFVHIKDIVAIATGRRRVTSLREVARSPVFVPETVPIDRVRRQLQARRTHFGIVVDEFGDFTGIVTLEDLLEELVGDIQDELDVEQPKILRKPDGSVEVDGGVLLDLAEKKIGLECGEEVDGVDTVGGYVFMLLGRAPVRGDTVVIGDHKLEILQVEELRIRRLRVTRIPPTPAPEVDAETPP